METDWLDILQREYTQNLFPINREVEKGVAGGVAGFVGWGVCLGDGRGSGGAVAMASVPRGRRRHGRLLAAAAILLSPLPFFSLVPLLLLLRVLLFFLDPDFQRLDETPHAPELELLVLLRDHPSPFVLLPRRQLGDRHPGVIPHLAPHLRREERLPVDPRHDEHLPPLALHKHLDRVLLAHHRPDVEAGLLQHLADRAVQVRLLLVHLSFGETPARRALDPAE
mmetsp:Transcript_7330/g.18064  ORF Transcript_7330/g.18064 Transcript_7330/m.18064 type:complete len:224 (-) Transcript_7330:368-1039(-)